jgi:molybdopterin-guanine dinucleotide biosynthesis protein A
MEIHGAARSGEDTMFDAVILAGGSARRLSGTDKPAVLVGTDTLLDRVVAAVAQAGRTVVVGPRRPVRREVIWTVEEPAGSGPVAALAAGLTHTQAGVVLVLAADLPWIAPVVGRLVHAVGADPAAECAVLVSGGRRNFLAAAWRRESLEAALSTLTRSSGLRDQAMRGLYDSAAVVEVTDTDDAGRDCDTWTDIAEARRRADLDRTVKELP